MEHNYIDSGLGKFFAVDPLAAKYPHNSPYAFSENRVIDGVELEGLEFANVHIYNRVGDKVTHKKSYYEWRVIPLNPLQRRLPRKKHNSSNNWGLEHYFLF